MSEYNDNDKTRDEFKRRTEEALSRIKKKHLKFSPVDEFLEELEEW